MTTAQPVNDPYIVYQVPSKPVRQLIYYAKLLPQQPIAAPIHQTPTPFYPILSVPSPLPPARVDANRHVLTQSSTTFSDPPPALAKRPQRRRLSIQPVPRLPCNTGNSVSIKMTIVLLSSLLSISRLAKVLMAGVHAGGWAEDVEGIFFVNREAGKGA